MKEVEVCLWGVGDEPCKYEMIKVTIPKDYPFGFPTIIKYKGDFYMFISFSFCVGPINYIKTRGFVDLDKDRDESLEEVLSKE